MFVPPISMSIDAGTLLYDRLRKRGLVGFFYADPLPLGLGGGGVDGERDSRPSVSVLVPAYNEGERIAKTVDSVMRQTYPAKNLFILDDISTDGTNAVCETLRARYPNVVHVRERKRGKAGNINALIRSRPGELGEYVMVLDGDVQMAPDCLEYLVRDIGDADVITGYGLTRKPATSAIASALYGGETWVNGVFSFRKHAQAARNAVSVICGALSMYRKELLQEIPVPERTLTEDTDHTWLILEHGRTIAYSDRAQAEGGSPDSLEGYWKRYRRWMGGTFQSLYVHGPDLAKSKSLLFTTLLPGVGEAMMYSVTLLSLPAIYAYDPEFAKGVALGDFLLTLPFLPMHPKGLLQGIKDLPGIYAFKVFGSAVTTYSALHTSLQALQGQRRWSNSWESTTR